MRVIREKSEVIALNNIVLAFVGDAVYSLKIRKKYALSLDAKPSAISDVCSEIVSAKSQARKVEKLIERGVLTDEEIESVCRRVVGAVGVATGATLRG